MGNIHFTEILDFFLGWFGYDVGGDDWATGIAGEAKAPDGPQPSPPEDPSREPAKKLPEEPPPKKTLEEPAPKPPKGPPPKKGKYRLEDLVP